MNHSEVYSQAELYDVAFDFRDVPAECDALGEIARRHAGRVPSSFLELAAGPAVHTCEMARRGLRSLALDLSPEMAALGRRRAQQMGVHIGYLTGDMRDFRVPQEPFDLAAILMDSAGYLLDNASVLAHLDCVADALVPHGIYIMEMSHPRDAFNVGVSAETDWVMERGDTRVHTIWGARDDPFDPLTQITRVTVRMEWERGGERGELVETAPERCFVPNELRALVAASGRFEIVEELGALDPDLPAGNDREHWRFVPVLRRL